MTALVALAITVTVAALTGGAWLIYRDHAKRTAELYRDAE